MTREDFDLVEEWIAEATIVAQGSEFQPAYREGWYNGLTRLQIIMDDYRKAHKNEQGAGCKLGSACRCVSEPQICENWRR